MPTNSQSEAVLLFPIIAKVGDQLVVSRKELFIKLWGLKRHSGSIFSYLEPSKGIDKNRIHWFIGRDALYREVTEIEIYRQYLRPFHFLMRLCRIRFRLEPARVIKIGELRKKIEGTKGMLPKDLRAFFKSHDDNTDFTPTHFKTILRHPPEEDLSSYSQFP